MTKNIRDVVLEFDSRLWIKEPAPLVSLSLLFILVWRYGFGSVDVIMERSGG